MWVIFLPIGIFITVYVFAAFVKIVRDKFSKSA